MFGKIKNPKLPLTAQRKKAGCPYELSSFAAAFI
jgi:hypothetical protein